MAAGRRVSRRHSRHPTPTVPTKGEVVKRPAASCPRSRGSPLDPVTALPRDGDGTRVSPSHGDIPSMPEAVCCPKCWTWDELGKRTSCKRCGTPLILADGRTATEAAGQGSATPLTPAFARNAPALPMVRITRAGVDWVDIARFFTIGYGLLVMAGLMALSLFLPSVKVPIIDPHTGLTNLQ